MNSAVERTSIQAVSPQRLISLTVLLSIAFSWIFWDFLQRQVRFAIQQQADWGHTLVIPFIAGYFVWSCKEQLLSDSFHRAKSGLILIFIGLSWYTLCALGPAAWHHHNLMGMGVSCTFIGIILYLFGWTAMRYLLFPMLYLFVFGQTISDRLMDVVTFKLQDIAAIGSYYGLTLFGLDVTRSGNTLEIFYNNTSYPLNIAEACSGMRMLMAFLALGVAMAYTSLPYVWQKVTLVLFAIPTAVFVNILRVMTLGILSIADSGFAAGDFHTFVGTLWLIPAFMIYLGIVWLLRNLVIEDDDEEEYDEDSQSTLRFSGSITRSYIIIIILLSTAAIGLQIGISSLNVYLHKEPVFPRKDFSILPNNIDNWEKLGEDIRIDAAGVEALGTNIYLNRVFKNTKEALPSLQLHIAYYTGQVDSVPHVPDRCMGAAGYVPLTAEPTNLSLDLEKSTWGQDLTATLGGLPYPIVTQTDILTGSQEIIRLPFGEFELRTSEFTHPKLDNFHIFAGYFFVANGKTTAYPERIRMLAFDPSAEYAYYCKIQFTVHGDSNYTQDQFINTVSEFVSGMLPEIMKCLPDWAEVTNQISIKNPEQNQES
ncbi:MAG: exosortase/archaeosortase family protein [Planctomycetota bacterium]|nr:exosortase/archaeosortase family protein [Planctomycetota bacterium]